MIVFDAERIGPWVCERGGGMWTPGRGTAIGREERGRLVAGMIYESLNPVNVFCHIAGEGNAWLNREFLWIIFDYPFRQLGVKRMSAPIASSNQVCRNFVTKLGFEHEATLYGAHPDGDILIYKITADACRWLELKK